jgi:hypothetical protein
MFCLTGGFFLGQTFTYPVAYNTGARSGYNQALLDVSNLLQTTGVTLDWNQFTNGTYKLTVTSLKIGRAHV